MTIFIVMLCLSVLALACSIFSFLQRGSVLSTNFLVSKKWAKKNEKRKNYYFCGFIFALFTIGFLLLGISALLRVAMLTYVAAILFVLTAITAIAFSIYTASSWCARQVSVRTRPATWSSELEVSKLQARCFSFPQGSGWCNGTSFLPHRNITWKIHHTAWWPYLHFSDLSRGALCLSL